MESGDFLDLVRLGPPQRNKLLATLEGGGEGDAARHGRRSSRHPCRGEMIPVVVLQPGKIVSPFMVLMRNVSAGGLSFIHGGYLHAGTACRVLLAKLEGEKVVLTGKVRRCRHIQGNLHEVGLEFESAIVPEDFVPADLLVTTVEELTAPEHAETATATEGAPTGEAAPGVPQPAHPHAHAPAAEHSKAA